MTFARPAPGLLLAAFLAACGAEESAVWTPVTLQSLEGTAAYGFRTGGAGTGLEVRGDFDGDGQADSAALVKNEAAGLYAVRVALASGETHMVAEGDLASLPDMALARVAPGDYLTACAKGLGACGADAVGVITLVWDGFTLSAFESGSRLFWWKDGAIDFIWVSD